METKDIIMIVVAVLGSTGLIGSIIALLKFKPEAGQIMITTAQGVLMVQTGVIDDLREEILRLHNEIKELREENQSLRERIRNLDKGLNGLSTKVDDAIEHKI